MIAKQTKNGLTLIKKNQMDDLELWENIKKSVKPLVKHQVAKHLIYKNIPIRCGIIIPYNLDLHGYTIQEAYIKLKSFVLYHYENNTKYIIVITGKGTPEKESLIHSEIEGWLNNPFFKNYIRDYEWINGNGAMRIYLIRHNK